MKKICALLCALLTGAGVFVAQERKTPDTPVPPGVTNYTRVDATFACGGATTAEAMPELKRQGFAAVINLRTTAEPSANVEAEGEAASAAGLKYIHIPFSTQSPQPGIVEAFLKAVSDKTNQPAYIHCASANRAGALFMIKRVLVDGWGVDKAIAEAEAIGLTSDQLKRFALDYLKSQGK